MELSEAEFTLEESYAIISWLVYLLGGRVTLSMDEQFWEDNFPGSRGIQVDHDPKGNPILVSEQ